MLCSAPLKAPLQIAADSLSLAVGTTWTPIGLPPMANGDPPGYVALTWDGDVWLNVRSRSLPSGDRGHALNPRQQPYVFDVRGEALGLFFFRYTTPATDVHITPLENS